MIAQKSSKEKTPSKGLARFAPIVFLFLCFIYFFNSSPNDIKMADLLPQGKSVPPQEQPDHSPKDPTYEHELKPAKFWPRWALEIQENKITVKKVGHGEEFNDDDDWSERLEFLVTKIIRLRQAGTLYTPENLDYVNLHAIAHIFKLCIDNKVDIATTLRKALGDNFEVNLVFLKSEKGWYIVALIFNPETSFDSIRDGVLQAAKDETVDGILQIKDEGNRQVIENYFYGKKLKHEDYWRLYMKANLIFPLLRPPQNLEEI